MQAESVDENQSNRFAVRIELLRNTLWTIAKMVLKLGKVKTKCVRAIEWAFYKKQRELSPR